MTKKWLYHRYILILGRIIIFLTKKEILKEFFCVNKGILNGQKDSKPPSKLPLITFKRNIYAKIPEPLYNFVYKNKNKYRAERTLVG